VSVFLEDLGVIEPPPLPRPVKIAYHDACHLAHAQKVTEAPRNLLRHIPHLTLMDLAESDLCCGSAGTYNLEQPEIAATLGQRKAENILRAGSHAVAAGNIGCIVQIRNHLERLGMQMPVFHTIEILDLAYEGGLALASLPPLAAPGVG
jgi:glycolate oxidase iron-sulfur subunit